MVTQADVSIVGLGREDPVPAKFSEVNLESPPAALAHLGVKLPLADSAGRPLDSGPSAAFLTAELQVRTLRCSNPSNIQLAPVHGCFRSEHSLMTSVIENDFMT